MKGGAIILCHECFQPVKPEECVYIYSERRKKLLSYHHDCVGKP